MRRDFLLTVACMMAAIVLNHVWVTLEQVLSHCQGNLPDTYALVKDAQQGENTGNEVIYMHAAGCKRILDCTDGRRFYYFRAADCISENNRISATQWANLCKLIANNTEEQLKNTKGTKNLYIMQSYLGRELDPNGNIVELAAELIDSGKVVILPYTSAGTEESVSKYNDYVNGRNDEKKNELVDNEKKRKSEEVDRNEKAHKRVTRLTKTGAMNTEIGQTFQKLCKRQETDELISSYNKLDSFSKVQISCFVDLVFNHQFDEENIRLTFKDNTPNIRYIQEGFGFEKLESETKVLGEITRICELINLHKKPFEQLNSENPFFEIVLKYISETTFQDDEEKSLPIQKIRMIEYLKCASDVHSKYGSRTGNSTDLLSVTNVDELEIGVPRKSNGEFSTIFSPTQMLHYGAIACSMPDIGQSRISTVMSLSVLTFLKSPEVQPLAARLDMHPTTYIPSETTIKKHVAFFASCVVYKLAEIVHVHKVLGMAADGGSNGRGNYFPVLVVYR